MFDFAAIIRSFLGIFALDKSLDLKVYDFWLTDNSQVLERVYTHMGNFFTTTKIAIVSGLFVLSACSTQEEMAAKPTAAPAQAAKAAPAKAKTLRARGNIGLLDTEKNYLILVTKEGKLVTLDFDQKTKVTKISPRPGKIADIGLGSSATVTYVDSKGKNVASGVEYQVKKGR